MAEDNGGRRPERILNPITGGRGDFTVEDLLDWIRAQFGGGGGGGNGSGGPKLPSGWKPFAIGAGAILGVLAIFTCFYTIDVSEEGVVTRFGRYHITTSPGLHFKLPWGIDQVTKVPSKVLLQEEFGFRSVAQDRSRTSYSKRGYAEESLMLTGDLNVADVEWILQYRISDPWKFLFHARNVRKNIRDVTMSIMRRVVGDRLVGDVLTVGRIEIADEAKVLTQQVLDKYDMGISVVAIMLQDVTPPEEVKAAFNEVNEAKQEQEKAINIAEREYNNIIPEAKGKAEQLIANAEGFSVSLVNRARGDAEKFNAMMAEYRRAPEITRRRMYIETMEEIYSNLDRLIIVDNKVKGVLPLYPGAGNLVKPPEVVEKKVN